MSDKGKEGLGYTMKASYGIVPKAESGVSIQLFQQSEKKYVEKKTKELSCLIEHLLGSDAITFSRVKGFIIQIIGEIQVKK